MYVDLVQLCSGLLLEREREKGFWSVVLVLASIASLDVQKKLSHIINRNRITHTHTYVHRGLSPNTMTLLPTLLPFKTLLRKHLPSLRSSPCLLISSSPPINTVQTNKRIDEFVRSSAQLLLSQNIRSIPITIDAAYPTKQKIKESLLVRR